MTRAGWLLMLLLVGCDASVGAGESSVDHGVILLYHHVSEETPALTSVSPDQFEQHLRFIEDNGFRVLTLSELLRGLYEDGAAPDNAVAITFDDAYASVYAEAFPRLRARGWPFTVFVADDPVDRGFGHFMSWAQMQELARAGAEFGGHSVSHDHLVRRRSGESEAAWRERVAADIDANVARLEQMLGVSVNAFAYPYGEFTEALAAQLADRGLYGLAQHSGAVGPGTSPTAIPRFPMMQSLAGMERLALALRSRPLPLSDSNPGPVIRREGEPEGVATLELGDGLARAGSLGCFSARGEPLLVEREAAQVTVHLPAFAAGRNKINCTAATNEHPGEFFWYSHQWLVQRSDGSWPEE